MFQKVLFFYFALFSDFQISATTSSISSIKILIENTAFEDKYF